MGQAVGLFVKLAIRQALLAMHHGHSLRRALDLGFEQPMNGLLVRVIQRGSVEPEDQLLTLCCRHNRQTSQRHLAGLLQCADHTLQRCLHIRADLLRIDTGNGLNGEAEAHTFIVH